MRTGSIILLALAACGGGAGGDDTGDDTTTADAPPAPDAAPAPLGVANGTLGAWTPQAAMPTPRANHCSAFVHGWVLAIGGNYRPGGGDFVKTDEIHAAKIGPDGSLGPWQLAGRTASPVTECSAMAEGDQLYIADGLYDVETDQGAVWTATLGADGMLTPMTRMGALPAARQVVSSEGFVRAGVLHLMDVELPAEDDDTLTLHVPVAGGLGAWSETLWHIGFRGQPEYAFADGFVYSLGGYLGDPGNTMSPTVNAAPIGPDGTMGAVFATTPLPAPVGFGEAVAVDGWVFVIGGRGQVFGAPGTTTVVAAPIGADGQLGAWTTLPPLPIARTNHEVVVAGDYLVLTGGAVNGPGEAVVYSARVRF